MAVFIDPKDGKRFENVPDDQVEAAQQTYGLVPEEQYAASQRTGGVGGHVLTGVETAAATVGELGEQVSRFAGDVDPLGNPINTVDPVPAETLVPGAFTPDALERRAANPLSAMAGAAAVEAPTLLLPGAAEGWAARLGLAGARAAVSGTIAEAGSAAITGDEFSPAHAAFYGVVGESLGALASGGIGRLMRATGKEAPSALELAAIKATRSDAADAVGELSQSPLKAGKLADNAAELTDQAVTDLTDHLTTVEKRLDKAEQSAFSKANVRRSVSSNVEAQTDSMLSHGVGLEDVSRQLVQDAIAPEHKAFAALIQDGVDDLLSKRSSADRYIAARELVKDLSDQAPANLPQYAQDAVSKLDDTLADESVWGGVAKSYGEARAARSGRQAFSDQLYDGVSVSKDRAGSLFIDGADRRSFESYLSSAESAAKMTGDKTLRKAVASAREAVAAGDEAIGSRLLRDTFAEKASDFITNKIVSKGAKYALGALGFSHGPVGAVAGAALGDAIGPAIGRAIRPVVDSAVNAAAPFVEEAGGRFAADGIRPVLQRLKQSAATQVQTAGRSLSNAALRASQSTIHSIGAPTVSVGIARFMGHHDNLRSSFNEKREVFSMLQTNPGALVDELSESLGSLDTVAPQLHAGIVAKTIQAVSYLRTKMPETIGVSLSSPSGIPPSQLAIRQWALYYSGATDPSSVVADVRNNRVRQEQLEALKSVWPEVYTDLRQSVLDGMSESRPSPQQRMRMDLLFDFGESLDAALSWRLVIANDNTRKAKDMGRPKLPPPRSSSRNVAASQPYGLEALSNPQTMQV